MVYIRSRKFCCCLPVRLGTFVLTIFATALCGLAAASGWIRIVNNHKAHIELAESALISLYVQTGVYTIGALVSFFGLIGTIFKRRLLVSLYAKMLMFHLGFYVVAGSIYLYFLFKNTSESDIQKCIDKGNSTLHTDPNKVTKEVCQSAFAAAKGFALAVFIVVCLIELYAVIIAANYAGQLEDEDAAKASKYSLGQMEPLHQDGHYAFTSNHATMASNRV